MSDDCNRTRRELSSEILLTLNPKQLCQYFAPEIQIRISKTEFWVPSDVKPNFLYSGVAVLNDKIVPLYQKTKRAAEKNLFVKILQTFKFLDEKVGPGTTARLFVLEEVHPKDFLGMIQQNEQFYINFRQIRNEITSKIF